MNRKKLQFEIIPKKLTYMKVGRVDTFLWNFCSVCYMIILNIKKGDTYAYTRTNRKLISKFFNKGM